MNNNIKTTDKKTNTLCIQSRFTYTPACCFVRCIFTHSSVKFNKKFIYILTLVLSNFIVATITINYG